MTDTIPGRDVLWRLTDGIGMEHCRLINEPDGPLLTGVVVTTEAGVPMTVEYSVRCDRFWHTRDVAVAMLIGGANEPKTLNLSSDGDGSWRLDGDAGSTAIPLVSGCIDIDLACTPATNTLPIRRHDMAVGAKIEVAAAWVQFPSLELAVLRQRYTRLTVNRYFYEAPQHQFTALIDVDNLGLLTAYQGVWERVAQSDSVLRRTGVDSEEVTNDD